MAISALENNILREQEIDEIRDEFEISCRSIVAGLTGWGDANWNQFDYDNVVYLNAWTDACWQSFIKGRLAAKVGDIIETPAGLFQVMKHPDSVDDSGITTDGLIRSYCAYCGTGNHDHLPNCKGANRV